MSQSRGDGLTEARNINRSLSALQDVLQALAKKKSHAAQHIPYRNSRLTYLLKDAIGGDAKMLLICCASPTQRFHTESVHVRAPLPLLGSRGADAAVCRAGALSAAWPGV